MKINIDWSKFKNMDDNMESVDIPYHIEKDNNKSAGVILKISQLQDIWDEKNK